MDACAIMAVIVKEPERDLVIQLTQNAVMVSPDMVSYEIANALTKMMKKKIIEKERMINAFNFFKKIPIKIIDEKKGKSPLEDIPYITADITTQEIVDLIRESRSGI